MSPGSKTSCVIKEGVKNLSNVSKTHKKILKKIKKSTRARRRHVHVLDSVFQLCFSFGFDVFASKKQQRIAKNSFSRHSVLAHKQVRSKKPKKELKFDFSFYDDPMIEFLGKFYHIKQIQSDLPLQNGLVIQLNGKFIVEGDWAVHLNKFYFALFGTKPFTSLHENSPGGNCNHRTFPVL